MTGEWLDGRHVAATGDGAYMARSGTSGSHPDYPGPVKHLGVTVGAWRVAACRHERPVGLLVDFRPATRLQACNSIPGSTVSDDALFTVLGGGCGRSGCPVANSPFTFTRARPRRAGFVSVSCSALSCWSLVAFFFRVLVTDDMLSTYLAAGNQY